MADDHREKAVEAAAEALWNEGEYREPTGDYVEGWCPPGHESDATPPREPALWEEMVEAGKYPGSQEETRVDARAVVAAADSHLRRAHFEELDLPQLCSDLQRIAEGRMTLDSTELLTWAEGWLLSLHMEITRDD